MYTSFTTRISIKQDFNVCGAKDPEAEEEMQQGTPLLLILYKIVLQAEVLQQWGFHKAVGK